MPQETVGDARRVSNSKLSVLRQHPIFRDLEPEALDQLCRYAKHTVLKRGATLFAKDDPGNSLYAVISGTVKIGLEPDAPVVADIELMFSHIDQNLAGLEFPEHNFVFTEQFTELLKSYRTNADVAI